jgi:16S rRNA processing protein RimM
MAETGELILIGVVRRPHGIRGQLKIWPLTDFPWRFKNLKSVFLIPKEGKPFTKRIEGVKFQGNFVLVKLEGIDDRTAAESLVGLELAVPRENCVELPEDTYYHFDLIGLDVVLSHGEKIGKVVDVLDFPAQDVLVVQLHSGREVMIPLVKAIVREISLAEKRILIEYWPGLLGEEE